MDTGQGLPQECCKQNSTPCSMADQVELGCLTALTVRLYLDRYVLGGISIISGVSILIMLVTSFFLTFDDDEEYDFGDHYVDDFCRPVQYPRYFSLD